MIVYKGVYPGWPWITSAADGTLYCVFREGTVHDYSANGKVLLCRSTNHGQTWSPAQVVVETPEVDDRNAAIAVLPGGDLLVTYNTYTRSRASQAMATRSRDGGTTWTQPQSLGEPNTRTRSGVCVLANGHLLLPYYVAPGNGALAALSQDNGKNWKTARVPDTEGFIGDEWDVLEIEPGRILGLLPQQPFADRRDILEDGEPRRRPKLGRAETDEPAESAPSLAAAPDPRGPDAHRDLRRPAHGFGVGRPARRCRLPPLGPGSAVCPVSSTMRTVHPSRMAAIRHLLPWHLIGTWSSITKSARMRSVLPAISSPSPRTGK